MIVGISYNKAKCVVLYFRDMVSILFHNCNKFSGAGV